MTDQPVQLGIRSGDDIPRLVRDAEATLRRYRKGLGIAGGGWSAVWVAGAISPVFAPLTFLAVPLAGISAAFFLSPTREIRRAREILRRWDAIRIDRAFDTAGAPSDQRLEAAEAMAERVLRSEAAAQDERLDRVVTALLYQLRQSVDDLRTIELARVGGSRHEGIDSHEDESDDDVVSVREAVEVRLSGLLTSLQRMHAAVLEHDNEALAGTLEGAEAMIGRLVARQDVERMLRDPPSDRRDH